MGFFRNGVFINDNKAKGFTPNAGFAFDAAGGGIANQEFNNLSGLNLFPQGKDTQIDSLFSGSKNSNSGGFGFNLGTFNLASNALSGIGNLAKGFAAIKQLGVARKELDFNKDVFNKNFAAQRTTTNNRINDQNAFKTAQGRTDLANLVV